MAAARAAADGKQTKAASTAPPAKKKRDTVQRCFRFPAPMLAWLEARSVQTGISEGEIVRRAVEEHRERVLAAETRR